VGPTSKGRERGERGRTEGKKEKGKEREKKGKIWRGWVRKEEKGEKEREKASQLKKGCLLMLRGWTPLARRTV